MHDTESGRSEEQSCEMTGSIGVHTEMWHIRKHVPKKRARGARQREDNSRCKLLIPSQIPPFDCACTVLLQEGVHPPVCTTSSLVFDRALRHRHAVPKSDQNQPIGPVIARVLSCVRNAAGHLGHPQHPDDRASAMTMADPCEARQPEIPGGCPRDQVSHTTESDRTSNIRPTYMWGQDEW